MTTEIECVVNLGAKQTADVGAVRVLPALVQLTANGGTADVFVLLDDKHAQTRFREKGGVRQAIVARTYDNGVVVTHRGIMILVESKSLAHFGLEWRYCV